MQQSVRKALVRTVGPILGNGKLTPTRRSGEGWGGRSISYPVETFPLPYWITVPKLLAVRQRYEHTSQYLPPTSLLCLKSSHLVLVQSDPEHFIQICSHKGMAEIKPLERS